MESEKLFKVLNASLNLSQLHPCIKKEKKWYLQVAFKHILFTLLFFLFVYDIVFHGLRSNNISQLYQNVLMCFVYFVVNSQFCALIFHQKSLSKLINSVEKDYRINSILKEQMIVKHHANLGLSVYKLWMVVMSLIVFSYIIKSILLMIYYYYINEFKFVSYHDIVYPAVIEDNKDNVCVYLILYMLEWYYLLYTAVICVAYIPLGPQMMLHASGQLEIVKTKIDHLFMELHDEAITKKLKSIIKQLQYICSFVDLINDIFKIDYELTLKTMIIFLSVSLYELVKTFHRSEMNVEFITFILGVTSSFFFACSPCYYGQLLTDKGEEVRLALYSSRWERYYDRRTRRTLCILLLCALRPVAVRTVFKTLSSETLMDIFQQSYAIFNLLNAISQ